MLTQDDIQQICNEIGGGLASQLYARIGDKLSSRIASAQKAESDAEAGLQTATAELADVRKEIDALKPTLAESERKAKEFQLQIDNLKKERDQLLPVLNALRAEKKTYEDQIKNILNQ
jgi:chromosome segregation ATPase